MGEHLHHTDPSKNAEASSPRIPPPGNPETMAGKIEHPHREESEELEKKQTGRSDISEPEYPSTVKIIPSVAALYAAFFLVALDRTIIATAIPRITDHFHSLGDVGWYGSAYMLTSCSFQLFMGRVYTFYNPKTVFLASICVFEIGSVICGAAPTSNAFIVGRAIAGSGASGIFSGAMIIIINLVPLHKRPLLQGMVGAIFGVASVAGPLLGGVFTSKVSWRWCFYINLPIGGVAMVVLFVILHIPDATKSNTPGRQQVKQLDPIGTFLFVCGIVCLLLALQWGGSTYPWNDGRIITLLALFILLMFVFIAVQLWNKENATVPPRIVKNRSIIAGMWSQFSVGSAMMIMIYYLPLWFQATKGVSAYQSGIDLLPLMLSLVVASITAGTLVQRIGYYTPFMLASSCIMSIGAGLITTFAPDTGHAKWIGYQVIFGFGMGLGMQQANLAAQAVLPRKDQATGVSLILFCQQVGGAVFVSIGQNVFNNELVKGLAGVPDVRPAAVVRTGATELSKTFDTADLRGVLLAYNGALVKVFEAALAMACLSIIGALSMEWKNIKKGKKQSGSDGVGNEEVKTGEAFGEESNGVSEKV